ncbi:serine/threonine protein kinase SAT4 Ecym_2744 [Eremothecium cymbalariae DBVPG|uniref:non-specific serine/threonine protein kinase n=1 Tax=Eremothecium cymbalariae (strain CBS 270.75 / DBVPG 7215 / KCTC 17166 / NRRL Y-17582) TaxID=931890 RepID=G8JPY1_ERECY|nr:Hypothetical protein Ecym_2744 [Eremothecium cymbalariae DBVPG\
MGSGSTVSVPKAHKPKKYGLPSKFGKLFGGHSSSSKSSPTPKELRNSSSVNSSVTLSLSQSSHSDASSSCSSSSSSKSIAWPVSPPMSLGCGGTAVGSKRVATNGIVMDDRNSVASSTSHSDSIASIRVVSPNNSNRSSPIQGLTPSASVPNPAAPLGRFVVHEEGHHEHILKNTKRQEKLSSMIKNMLGAQKLRGEAKSAVPDILLGTTGNSKKPGNAASSGDLPTLFSGLMKQFSAVDSTDPFSGATQGPKNCHYPQANNGENDGKEYDVAPTKDFPSFAEKYGRCQEVIGKGAFGVVRICHKKGFNGEETLYAVKEFKKRPSENPEKYSRRLTSEFCISSSLKHPNIIETLDLFQDAKGDYCEVMEYCSGGDLFTLIIAAGKLEYMEADCFFKQMIRGVVYMHDMGVCHRDLKPENLILTSKGLLKITDFGNGECFRMAWEKDIHLSGGVCGSSPYIAPEEYTHEEFDPRPVDIWACGTIYMAMRTGRQLWRTAQKEDEFYARYLKGRKDEGGYEPIEQLKRARCRNVIYSILDPVPSRRINGRQILNSEWGREIKCCTDGALLK